MPDSSTPPRSASGAGPRPRTGRGPGMHDVARAAGVSQKTVSRVVNGEPHVSDDVRARVQQAIDALGYRPNTAARALIRGRYGRLGVVSVGVELYGPSAQLVALQRVARSRGYAVASEAVADSVPDGQAEAIDSLLAQGVDGIVVLNPVGDGAPIREVGDVPVVSLALAREDGIAPARAATEHLLALGHHTVWHLPGPQEWWSARDRLQGWREALAAAGAPEPPLPEAGDWTAASGYAAGIELARVQGLTAVFAANDDMAIGAMRAFAEAGLDVPGQVSVMGYDDIPLAAYVTPQLSTVKQDFPAVAERAVDLLLTRIERHPDPQAIARIPVQLVLRESTARPAARH
ncbi:LacI family DNA-binding transcriptional regulator [Streptomyces sp. NPDC020845]|uniref:LacI family DNA-binding transcriptional regulator n=1 Tax=Streptomyces sp. NPDC020845 TaxID=3365096 RepID=UPI00379B05BF